MGLVLDVLYQLFKSAHSTYNPTVRKALSSSTSADEEYLAKVIEQSIKNEAEAQEIIQKQMQMEEEKKEQKTQKSLSQLIDDMDLEEGDEVQSPEQIAQAIGVSKDINLIK